MNEHDLGVVVPIESYHRSLGGFIFLLGVAILACLVFLPDPYFVQQIVTGQDKGAFLFLFLIVIICLVWGGWSFMYGHLQFHLQDEQMVIWLRNRELLRVDYERITAVRYRSNWLQLYWQGRGAWFSYWLALPLSQEPDLHETYHQWLPILQKQMVEWKQKQSGKILVRAKWFFLSLMIVMTLAFMFTGGNFLWVYGFGDVSVAGWDYVKSVGFIILLFVVPSVVLAYWLLWKTVLYVEITPDKIRLQYVLREVVWQTAVSAPTTITRSHVYHTHRGGRTRIETVVLTMGAEDSVTLKSNELVYKKGVPSYVDFDLLAHHITQIYT